MLLGMMPQKRSGWYGVDVEEGEVGEQAELRQEVVGDV